MPQVEEVKNLIVKYNFANGVPMNFTYPVDCNFTPDQVVLVSYHFYSTGNLHLPFIVQTNLVNDDIQISETIQGSLLMNMPYQVNKGPLHGMFNFSILYNAGATQQWSVANAAAANTQVALTFQFIRYKKDRKEIDRLIELKKVPLENPNHPKAVYKYNAN